MNSCCVLNVNDLGVLGRNISDAECTLMLPGSTIHDLGCPSGFLVNRSERAVLASVMPIGCQFALRTSTRALSGMCTTGSECGVSVGGGWLTLESMWECGR